MSRPSKSYCLLVSRARIPNFRFLSHILTISTIFLVLNCKYALDESFHGHICPRRKAAKFCHPALLETLDDFEVDLMIEMVSERFGFLRGELVFVFNVI